MKLMRYNDPFADLSSLHNQIDDMFNAFFGQGHAPFAFQNVPHMDVYNEDDKQLVAEISAPGFNKDDIEIQISNGVLEIQGNKEEKQEEKDKKRTYMVRESSSSFYRRIGLPKHADTEKVEANFENGILKVVIPFKELPKPKKVAIKAKK